jgi:hypothetical protein
LGGGYKSNADFYGGHFVCESVSSTANFNLITAAPDLLAAAKAVLLYSEDPEAFAPLEAAIEELENAIAKAEGRDAE